MKTYDPETGEVFDPVTVIDNDTGAAIGVDGFKRHQRILELKSEIEIKGLELGKELHLLDHHKQYEVMGHSTFNSYIADPEIGLKRRTAQRLMAIYRMYVLNLECASQALSKVGTYRLDIMRPYMLNPGVDVPEWLEKAEGLSGSDLKKELEEAFPPPPDPPLPPGQFNVIYADPAWKFNNSGFDQSAEQVYESVMGVDEICKMEVKARSAENAVLFLWGVASQVPEAMRVMEAWGFEYKTCMVWVKNRAPGMGWWVHTYHELLFIGERGSFKPKEKFKSVIEAPVTQHSRKPDEFYTIIEQMYPGAKYLELFARRPRDGWASYGNELPMPEISKEEKVA